MNPFLSWRFLVTGAIFFVCLGGTLFLVFRGDDSPWRWKDNYQESSAYIADYDYAKTYPAKNGTLIITQKNRRSSYYYNRLDAYASGREDRYQVLFANQEGVRFITQDDNSFYNVVCDDTQCLLMVRGGYRTVNLSDYSVGPLTPWKEGDGEYVYSAITGNIYQSSPGEPYVLIDSQNIFTSVDKGLTWQYLMNPRELVKRFYPEEIADNSTFSYAVHHGNVVMWYSYGNEMGSLEVVVNIAQKTVVSHRWLPIRINEAAQNLKGDIYLIAQEPSRRLFSLYQYQNGDFKLIREAGYNHLQDMKVANDGLLVAEYARGALQYLTLDFASGQLHRRSDLEWYNKLFIPELQGFIELSTDYSDESALAAGTQLRYRTAY
ncbi:hypothetical protein NVI2019_PEGOAJLN_03181 [Providencia alcalifaciens]|uniref:hypothetical protein n=1 Tax=Providencia alcalifaciens TaxID=126385 RepID=UPI00044FEF34|nr:hypothetical protein [Providencia alcalifaciens]EUD02047.1 hypothetical protein HMPREF1565_2260 [Providencia alcalifaciens RIMD 1656011]CAG9430756.1 hypothetical protein NVI2019_PEGOAJLN_03181 [Providencia alcalifaciens]